MGWQHHRPRRERLNFKRETNPPLVLVVVGGAGDWEVRDGLLPGASFLRDGRGRPLTNARTWKSRGQWFACLDGNCLVKAFTRQQAVLKAIFASALAKPATPEIAEHFGVTQGEKP